MSSSVPDWTNKDGCLMPARAHVSEGPQSVPEPWLRNEGWGRVRCANVDGEEERLCPDGSCPFHSGEPGKQEVTLPSHLPSPHLCLLRKGPFPSIPGNTATLISRIRTGSSSANRRLCSGGGGGAGLTRHSDPSAPSQGGVCLG